MHTSPHITCSKVLDTVRLSGLTYSLTETPYSTYISIRKKFTKGFSPITPSSTSSLTSSSTSSVVDTNLFSNDNQTQASEIEIANHNHTKNQLLVKEAELSKLTSSITKLTQELSTEIDDHAESEQELRRLEEKCETLSLKLDKQAKENKALKDNIASSEEDVAHYQKMSQSINQSLAQTQIKLAEAHNAEAGILTSRVHELEGTVSGKNRIISLLKDEARISQIETSDLRSILSDLQAETVEYSADTADTPLHILKPDTFSQSVSYLNSSSLSLTDQQTPSPLPQLLPSAFLSLHNTSLNKSQSDTALGTPDDQTVSADTLTDDHNSEKDEVNKVTDINDNMAPNPNRFSHTNSSQDAEASFPDLPHSNKSTPSHTSLTDPESLCNNCHNKPENDDIDMDLPPPIYEPNFIRECPSPWLHYGYCTACLEVAGFESLQRGQGNTIIEHIAQCPGLLNLCFTGYHEEHIKMYTERENEIKL